MTLDGPRPQASGICRSARNRWPMTASAMSRPVRHSSREIDSWTPSALYVVSSSGIGSATGSLRALPAPSARKVGPASTIRNGPADGARSRFGVQAHSSRSSTSSALRRSEPPWDSSSVAPLVCEPRQWARSRPLMSLGTVSPTSSPMTRSCRRHVLYTYLYSSGLPFRVVTP